MHKNKQPPPIRYCFLTICYERLVDHCSLGDDLGSLPSYYILIIIWFGYDLDQLEHSVNSYYRCCFLWFHAVILLLFYNDFLNWICLLVAFGRKSIVLTTYSFIVYPCNEPNLWPSLQTLVMLPPVMRRAPERPKKERNKRNDESTKRSNLARQWKSIVCKKCRKIGHNKRTCKGKTSIDRSIPKGGNKVIWLE